MTVTEHRVDTWEMVLVHRAFRREFRLLPSLIRAVEPGDRSRAAVVAGHLADLTGALHHHHAAEDELLWPLLTARVGIRADVVHRMEVQHERLHELLTQLDEHRPQWQASADRRGRDMLADAVALTSAALDEHLAEEEAHILPLVSEHISHAEWQALNTRAQEAIPKNAKGFVFVGMILEEASRRESAMFMRQLPLPVRWIWPLAGRRIFAKAKARIRG